MWGGEWIRVTFVFIVQDVLGLCSADNQRMTWITICKDWKRERDCLCIWQTLASNIIIIFPNSFNCYKTEYQNCPICITGHIVMWAGQCQVGVSNPVQTLILVFYILHTRNLMSFTKLLLVLQENTQSG